ncbi:hypothetical protein IPZ58_05020 [Streptomyces roseoverticillatus]|uniref:hypothetical protein n=1 Tax=Streptomyces roseoverticillatus TaxID=66429 RepID=UPI001F42D31C|nr:hypothetical protein [Streptomyces roseoverticillatus]MCF3100936.1 hypothetical protein [Streptomyces roseoverticillatus]
MANNQTPQGTSAAPAVEALGPTFSARSDYGLLHGRVRKQFFSNVISPQTRVFISVSEGSGDNKFVGDAPFSVENVAPSNGVVEFRLFIDWPTDLGTVVDFLFVNPS